MASLSKRFIALKLALIMFISIVPFGIFNTTQVLANTGLGIDVLSRSGNIYELFINWNTATAPEPGLGDPWVPNNFVLEFQNLSDPSISFEDFIEVTTLNLVDGANALPTYSRIELNLEPSSIYRFRVRTTFSRLADGLTSLHSVVQDIIFVTDIDLETSSIEGYDDRFEISWIVPRIEVADSSQPNFFDMFTLHAGTIPGTGPGAGILETLMWDYSTEVFTSSLEIEYNANERPVATHVWVDGNFSNNVNHLYGMRIEPSRLGIPSLNMAGFFPGENNSIDIPTIAIGTGFPDGGTVINQILATAFSRNMDLYTSFGVYISPILSVDVHDLNSIALSWSPISAWQPGTQSRIEQLRIFRNLTPPNAAPSEQPIVAFLGQQAHNTIRFLESPIPQVRAEYRFEVDFAAMDFWYHHPILLGENVRPIYNLGAFIMHSNISVFHPGITEFTPYIPHIHQITDNREDPFTMDITWEGFLRDPISADELLHPLFGSYLDTNITYRIWVTDDRFLFPSIPDDMVIELDASELTVRSIFGNAVFDTTVDSFVTFEDGGFVERPLEENTIYYVRIVAIRNEATEDGILLESEAAYGAHFIIPINNIPTDPNMLSRPPLRIQVINGVPQVTEDSITVEWEEQWFEVFYEGTWHSGVALTEGADGWNLTFSEHVSASNNILMTSRAYNPNGTLNIDITRQRIVELITPHVGIPVIRLIDLTGASYQVHTVLFENAQLLGFENYLDIINAPDAMGEWVNITPIGSGTLVHTVNTAQNPEGALQPDTAYIIFVRPFEGSADGDRIAFFPSFVSATTIEPRPPLDVTPIVPIIRPIEYGDTYLTVRWEHVMGLDYELRFSENINDYSEGGILIEPEAIRQGGIIVHENDRDYIEFTITGLFPNSPHFIWVRSLIIVDDAVEATSAWSNFIEMITLPLRAPQPPRGLGLASRGNLDIFNRENDTTHTPLGPNHMIVEWMRDPNDIAPVTGTTGADDDLAQPLYSTAIENSFLLRFNELTANRRYHVRARTTVIITRGGGNEVLREFVYTIQLSANGEFTDAIEIHMQDAIPEGAITQVATIQSDWVQVSIFTGRTDEEFDGNIDPEMVPLPESDFEMVFNSATNTLTYRFRSNQVDANGNRDNNVDQRFISSLVTQRVFLHEVDVSRYNNRVVDNRVVEIPFVIIEAFVERQIDLKVVAENLSVTIPHGSIVTNDVRALPGLDRTTRVLINMSTQPAPTSNAISTPHNLSIQFIEGVNSVTVSEFEKPLLISMSIPSSTDMVTSNVSGYTSNINSGGWQRLNSTHNPLENAISFAVLHPGTYTIKASTGAINVGATNATLAHMHRVNSNLHIIDLTVFDENATIHANQFNQIIAAVARRASTVEMNVPLSNDYFVTLGRSGMLVSGETVSRQNGINSLTRLYEVRTGYPITFFSPLEQTGLSDIVTAGVEFQTGLLKAESVGFFRGSNADPHGYLTMGDLMFILDIIFTV